MEDEVQHICRQTPHYEFKYAKYRLALKAKVGYASKQQQCCKSGDVCLKKDYANSCKSTLADRWAVLIDLLLAVHCCAVPPPGKDQGTAGLP